MCHSLNVPSHPSVENGHQLGLSVVYGGGILWLPQPHVMFFFYMEVKKSFFIN